MTETKIENPAETVGRKYTKVRFGVHCRRLGTESWYGLSNYKSEADAVAAMETVGKRFQKVGVLTIDTGEPSELFEYRIVQEVAEVTVLQVHTRKI